MLAKIAKFEIWEIGLLARECGLFGSNLGASHYRGGITSMHFCFTLGEPDAKWPFNQSLGPPGVSGNRVTNANFEENRATNELLGNREDKKKN